jgi:hypothetical protein
MGLMSQWEVGFLQLPKREDIRSRKIDSQGGGEKRYITTVLDGLQDPQGMVWEAFVRNPIFHTKYKERHLFKELLLFYLQAKLNQLS